MRAKLRMQHVISFLYIVLCQQTHKRKQNTVHWGAFVIYGEGGCKGFAVLDNILWLSRSLSGVLNSPKFLANYFSYPPRDITEFNFA